MRPAIKRTCGWLLGSWVRVNIYTRTQELPGFILRTGRWASITYPWEHSPKQFALLQAAEVLCEEHVVQCFSTGLATCRLQGALLRTHPSRSMLRGRDCT
mmetsp:Transcript_4938/g.6993  ORF Transcript_4938/g.6993 Transcript_4938/m.6993 type:complete len:100 (+) Transcript_4938:45-344(+)